MVFLLKLTVCWGFFALLYTLLLRKETFFVGNRIYLLGTLAAGIVMAACPNLLPAYKEANGIHVIALPAVGVGLQQAAEASNRLKKIDYVWITYLLGVFFMLVRTGWGIYRLIGMVRTGVSEPLPGGAVLIRSTAVIAPFSFFKWIFVPAGHHENLPDSGARHMLAHERAHVDGWHSLDVMLLELVCALCWFHPLAYWYRRSLRTVHEYLADARASRLTDKKQYGLLLIRQSQSGMPVAFANHFFQSPLKQRLIMLMKKHSPRARAFRYTLVLPLAALFILLFQQAPAIAQEVKAQYDDRPQSAQVSAEKVFPLEKTTNASPCNEAPVFPGGLDKLPGFFAKNMQYPSPVDGKYEEGTVVVTFTVKPDGYIKDVHLTEPSGLPAAYDAEALRVVSMLPQWTPGKKDCKPAAYELCVPIKFKADVKSGMNDGESVKELNEVETMPEFPGGEKAMIQYLAKNIEFPKLPENTQTGTLVVVKFMVNANGAVSNAEMVKSSIATDERLNAEALRVVRGMPNWTPAQKDGKPVSVYFTLPIRFEMK